MDMTICVKTKTRFANDDTKIAYFGFFDYEAEKAGRDEPYRHVDGDYMDYTRTVFGYRVRIHSAYDLSHGRYLNADDLRKIKLMYARFEDEYASEDKNVDKVWIEDGSCWSDVINFM